MTADIGLVVDDVTVEFGGTRALDGVSVRAPMGQITGLIGPNGAGKTTLFNACNGLLRPSAGRVQICGVDVTSRSTAARAQLGLGRTFQRMELCSSMTARANVELGSEARDAGSSVFRQVFGSRVSRTRIAHATAHALELCGVAPFANEYVGALSTGQRRLVELARVVASRSQVLLLDEPSSGLDTAETESFGKVLETVVREQGIGILLVEHDMALVLEVCDQIFVLEFGRIIFDGPPEAVRSSPIVHTAYLGGDADEREVASGAP